MPGFQTDVPRWARVYADHPDTAVTGGSASQAVPSLRLAFSQPGPAFPPLKLIIPAPTEGQL